MINIHQNLMASLINLLSEYSAQKNAYPNNVVVADELALDFDSALKMLLLSPLGRSISATQKNSLERLNNFLDVISGESNKDLWTLKALENSTEWETVRIMARDALKSFGWDGKEKFDRPIAYYSE
jgi:hypothetical protein